MSVTDEDLAKVLKDEGKILALLDSGLEPDRVLIAAAGASNAHMMRVARRRGATAFNSAMVAVVRRGGPKFKEMMQLCLDFGATDLESAAEAAVVGGDEGISRWLLKEGAKDTTRMIVAAAKSDQRYFIAMLAVENDADVSTAQATATNAGTAQFCRELGAGTFWPPADVLRGWLLGAKPRKIWYNREGGESVNEILPTSVRRAIGEIILGEILDLDPNKMYPVVYESDASPRSEELVDHLMDPSPASDEDESFSSLLGEVYETTYEWTLELYEVPDRRAFIVDFYGWPGDNQVGAIAYVEVEPWKMIYLFRNSDAQLDSMNPAYHELAMQLEEKRLKPNA